MRFVIVLVRRRMEVSALPVGAEVHHVRKAAVAHGGADGEDGFGTGDDAPALPVTPAIGRPASMALLW
ncbi:hypothetical protein ACFUEN_05505 [Streptomyces griseorubiginosus]|uniref:hypothetical protein n=1 Tax=Streptomyces griseorubiginosus TaxID=67304 RepID=UPI00363AA70B